MTQPTDPVYEVTYVRPNKTVRVPASELESVLRQINQQGFTVTKLTIPPVDPANGAG